jgi:hypothetical protein
MRMVTKGVAMTKDDQLDHELSDDVLWGADEIARYVKRSKRQVYYLIDKGVLKVRKHSHRIISARKSELDRTF